MAKNRNRDIHVWRDPWYRKLPFLYKLLWTYLCDNCDDAGVWKEDLDLLQFQIGCPIDKDKAMELFNEGKPRLIEFKLGYWLIKDFIRFHYGKLTPNNNYHRYVSKLVNDHEIEGLVSPRPGTKDKDKDKSKDKSSDKGKDN